jgi:hypothetical protein
MGVAAAIGPPRTRAGAQQGPLVWVWWVGVVWVPCASLLEMFMGGGFGRLFVFFPYRLRAPSYPTPPCPQGQPAQHTDARTSCQHSPRLVPALRLHHRASQSLPRSGALFHPCPPFLRRAVP